MAYETAKNNEDMSYTSLRCSIECATKGDEGERENWRISNNGRAWFQFYYIKKNQNIYLGLTLYFDRHFDIREKSSIIINCLVISFSELLHRIKSLIKIFISQKVLIL